MLQKRDIQEETFLPSFEGRSNCFEDPIISLLPNIPVGKNDHLRPMKCRLANFNISGLEQLPQEI
jgi:hypothetical protein